MCRARSPFSELIRNSRDKQRARAMTTIRANVRSELDNYEVASDECITWRTASWKSEEAAKKNGPLQAPLSQCLDQLRPLQYLDAEMFIFGFLQENINTCRVARLNSRYRACASPRNSLLAIIPPLSRVFWTAADAGSASPLSGRHGVEKERRPGFMDCALSCNAFLFICFFQHFLGEPN